MTMNTLTMNPASSTARPSMIARLLTAWAQRKEMQRTYRELDSLSDRELNDIGISRCDIRRVAMGVDVRFER
jgi:uncharacterized protein YjiS (DUF1127 family)